MKHHRLCRRFGVLCLVSLLGFPGLGSEIGRGLFWDLFVGIFLDGQTSSGGSSAGGGEGNNGGGGMDPNGGGTGGPRPLPNP